MTSLRLRGTDEGPTLVLVAGIHGNEPAGVEACRRLFERLRERPPPRGEIAAFEGNPAALAAGRRFLTRDLNRQWTPGSIAAARAAMQCCLDHAATDDEEAPKGGPSQLDPETVALAGLAEGLDDVLATARGPVYALDLHTTSAAGVPFSIVGPTEAERSFARALVVPAITGLVEGTPGTLSGYLSGRGCVAVAIEGGQHESPATVANLEAIITAALVASGLAGADEPRHAEARALLECARGALPPLIEVVSRHAVRPGCGFQMVPGFINIQRTECGTLLAREHDAEFRAPFDGFVLLPLYQAQGDDGFFYGREVIG